MLQRHLQSAAPPDTWSRNSKPDANTDGIEMHTISDHVCSTGAWSSGDPPTMVHSCQPNNRNRAIRMVYATGWRVRGSIPGRSETFFPPSLKRLDWLGPTQPSVVQRPGAWGRGYERLELYLYSPTRLWARIAQSIQRLATGWTVRGSNTGGGEIFRTRPDRPWGPSSTQYNGYQVLPAGKVAGAWR